MKWIFLQFCSSRDVIEFEKRHYVEKMTCEGRTERSKEAGQPRGHHGQQIHYKIWLQNENAWENVGVISGGSAVFSCKPRDSFFGIDGFPKPRSGESSLYLSGIIDNTLFRLEQNEKNLASKILSLWRKKVVKDWKEIYSVEAYGFETFVQQDRDAEKGFRQTDGTLYKADNWIKVGETFGNTKDHVGKGLTGGRKGNPFNRRTVSKKTILCKWIAPHTKPLPCVYRSSWKCETKEEKAIQKERSAKRKELTLRDEQELQKLKGETCQKN